MGRPLDSGRTDTGPTGTMTSAGTFKSSGVTGPRTTEDTTAEPRHVTRMRERLKEAKSDATKDWASVSTFREKADTAIRASISMRHWTDASSAIEEYEAYRASIATGAATDVGKEDLWTKWFVSALSHDSEPYDPRHSFAPGTAYKTPISRHIQFATQKTEEHYATLFKAFLASTPAPRPTGTTTDHAAAKWWEEHASRAGRCLELQRLTHLDHLALVDQAGHRSRMEWDELRSQQQSSKASSKASSKFARVQDEDDEDEEGTDTRSSKASSNAAGPSSFTPSQTSDAPSNDVRPSSNSREPPSVSGISLGTMLTASLAVGAAGYTAYQWWKD